MARATTEHACPECGDRMEEGVQLDGRYQAEWMKGAIEKTFWTSATFKGKERRRIVSWRCTGCGLLKSYAKAPPV